MAALALFLVVSGGTAFAVVAANQVNSASIIDGQVKNQDLAANSVTTGKVLNESLTGFDLADNSLTGKQIIEGQLSTVPRAARGGTLFESHIDGPFHIPSPGRNAVFPEDRSTLRLHLPPGAYVLTAKASFTDSTYAGGSGGGFGVICEVRADGDYDEAGAEGGHVNLYTTVAHETNSAFNAELTCIENGSDKDFDYVGFRARLQAILINNVTRCTPAGKCP
jgi:hypothetical protein